MHRLTWLPLVLCLVGTGPAFAQDAADDAERRSVLAHRLIEASQGDSMAKRIDRQVREQLADLSGVTDEQAAWMRANTPRMIMEMVADMMDSLTDLYAETYTAEELQVQIDLFESPHGRAIANKSFDFGLAQNEIMAAAQTAFLTELLAKFCAEFDCQTGDAENKPAARR